MAVTSALTTLHSFQRRDIHEELLKSQKVFSEKLNHLSRRLAWINVTIYSKVGRSITWAAGRRLVSLCISAAWLTYHRCRFPGVEAMPVISGAAFSIVVYGRLLSRFGSSFVP